MLSCFHTGELGLGDLFISMKVSQSSLIIPLSKLCVAFSGTSFFVGKKGGKKPPKSHATLIAAPAPRTSWPTRPCGESFAISYNLDYCPVVCPIRVIRQRQKIFSKKARVVEIRAFVATSGSFLDQS